MAYNPGTDFLGLWRNVAGTVSKEEMPGLDFVVSALARAGLITISVSATAPVANQAKTAWLQTAVPSSSAEGTVKLWNPVTTQYENPTPGLYLELMYAYAGDSGVSWWDGNGVSANTLGNNGDFYVRLDTPYGIYGPKAGGVWPANPVPGTADVVTSASLDNAFGAAPGQILFRGNTVWQTLPIGGEDNVLTSLGGFPAWDGLNALFDVIFGNAQGSVLYRDAAVWNDLPPGTDNTVLTTHGIGANPSWTAKSSEFLSGTVLVFYMATAPIGWTKQTAINDCGLRVTSGTGGGFTAGSAFSTVFAQTVVGDTTLSVAQMPNHNHPGSSVQAPNFSASTPGGGAGTVPLSQAGSIASQGGGAAHAHSINLTLAYADVIIASKN